MEQYDPWGKDYRPGFSDEMKQVHGIGPVYFFRVKAESKRVQRGFMREIDPPYRTGQGLQLRMFGKVWGLGLCRKGKYESDYEATAAALEAHDISEDSWSHVLEIGDWGVEAQAEDS